MSETELKFARTLISGILLFFTVMMTGMTVAKWLDLAYPEQCACRPACECNPCLCPHPLKASSCCEKK